MYTPGNILYFNPFFFKNGDKPKAKYFIILKSDHTNTLVASLPTSKDHVPEFLGKKHGCINVDECNFNCYLFLKGNIVTDNNWAFPRDTYVYGNLVDVFDKSIFNEIYTIEGVDYEIIGKLTPKEFNHLKACIVNSNSVKRKVRNLLKG